MSNLFAQADVELKLYSQKYPDKLGVVLENSRSAQLSVEGDSLIINVLDKKNSFIITDKSDYFSESEIYYSDESALVSLNAWSLIPDGSKYKKIKVNNFQESHDYSDNIFYDENKKTKFIYSSLVQGAKIYQEYELRIKEPRFFGRYFFEQSLPVEKSYFELIVPEGVDFAVYKFGEQIENIKYETIPKGKNTIHRWSMENIKPYVSQDEGLPFLYNSPHIIIIIKSYKSKSGKLIEVTPNFEGFFKWYSSLISKVDVSITDEIKMVTDSLVKGKSTDMEKLKSIYYWVQENINYVAIEHGMEGLIPRAPGQVMLKRYGDCKDMTMLIHAMSKHAGVVTYPTWIGTRDLPYTYEQIPSMFVDNHMIVSYIDEKGKTYFLDGTSTYLSVDHPSSFIQGKQALLYKSASDYQLAFVPVVETKNNYFIDTVYLKVVNDSLVGNGIMSVEGYNKQNIAANLNSKNTTKKIEFFELITQKGNNKFKLDTAFSNVLNRDSVFKIYYKFVIRDYLTSTGDEVYLNLNLEKSISRNLINIEQSPYPIYRISKIMFQYHYVLEIPEGYKLEYVPENYEIGDKYRQLKTTYRVEGNKLVVDQKATIDYLVIATADFVSHNTLLKKINQAYNQSISLKKIK